MPIGDRSPIPVRADASGSPPVGIDGTHALHSWIRRGGGRDWRCGARLATPQEQQPSQANPDRQEVTAEPLADVVRQQSEGVYLDLTARRHVQGEQPCWCAVDEGHPVPQVWSPQVGLSLLVIRPLTGPLVRTADADGRATDQW